jgi:hypothetical protein
MLLSCLPGSGRLRSAALLGVLLGLAMLPGVSVAQEKPKDPYAPRLTEFEQRIEAALAVEVDWNYRDVPLRKLFAEVSQQVDLPIRLSAIGLEEAGVAPDEPITLDVGKLSLRGGLQLLGIKYDLGYAPSATGLQITSVETAKERLVTRVYPVADLLPEAWESDLPPQVAMGSGCVPSVYYTLLDLIENTITPDDWVDMGGPASISGYGGNLVISHTLEAHQRIAQLLAALRKAKADQAEAKEGEVGPAIALGNAMKLSEVLNKRDSSTIDMELKWYVRDVSKLVGVPILIDRVGLAETGVVEDQLVHAAYRDAPVRDVFREVLGELRLSVALLDEFVIVTSRDRAHDISQDVRLYPVADLVQLDDDSILDFDSLLDLIETTVSPDSWRDAGGWAALNALPDPTVLVIDATDDMHRQVEKLLADLRAQGGRKVTRERNKQLATTIVERVYPLYRRRRDLQAKIALAKATPAAEKKDPPKEASSPAKNDAQPQYGGIGGMIGVSRPQIAEPIPSSDDVAKLVRELLPDDSWKEEGVLLRPFNDVLIVRQRPAMHRKIERLLMQIDAWHGFPSGWE